MAKVLKKEDFPEPVTPIIMILMNGTFGVNGSGNFVNLFKYSTTIYKVEIIIKKNKKTKSGRRNIYLSLKVLTQSTRKVFLFFV